MAVVGSTIIAKVGKKLNDEGQTRWTDAELLADLNEAQRQIVFLKPNAYSIVATVLLVAGVKQTIPSGSIQLLDVTRNMGTDGVTPGDTITQVMKRELDAIDRSWPTAASSSAVQHFFYEPEKDRKTFYCYPPQPAAAPGYVELIHSDTPADLATSGSNITLDDIYQDAIFQYMMYLGHIKEVEEASMGKAQAWYAQLMNTLGLRTSVADAFSPKPGG